MTVSVYVEGGGNSKALKSKCRQGFKKFFEAAGLKGQMPRVISSGSRESAFSNFKTAFKSEKSDRSVVLLVDSEGPVDQSVRSWEHLRNKDRWKKPNEADEDSAHLMVQCMESWFLADQNCLERYFGQGFNANALPSQSEIEVIPTGDVLDALRNATRQCNRNKRYLKARHSFEILSEISPACLTKVSNHAAKLIKFLSS